jgi:Domain of Unknown Function (DUF1080)
MDAAKPCAYSNTYLKPEFLTFDPDGERLSAMKNSTRTTIIVFSFLLTLAFAPKSFAAELAAPVAPTERIELFNGKDFSGWTFFMRSNAAPSDTFAITNGILHCTGQPYGYVRTDKDFRDYKLTVERRFVKVAPHADNTGVFVHVQGPDKIWPRCIENQGMSQHQGDLIFVDGATCKGHETAQTRSVPMQGPHNEKPVGEWNTYEIVCSGDSLKVYVNGKLMNEAEGCNVSSGAIAIQSEGGEWEARKVFLEPLKSS